MVPLWRAGGWKILGVVLWCGMLPLLGGCGGGGGGGAPGEPTVPPLPSVAPSPSWAPSPTSGPLPTPTPAPRGDLGYYDPGNPELTVLWVDGAHGDDRRDGLTREGALRTLEAAWDRVPPGALTGTGYQIRLCPGRYERSDGEAFWLEGRHGTREHPVWITAAEGPGTVTLRSLTVHDCRFLYLTEVTLAGDDENVLHLQGESDHVLLRDAVVRGAPPASQTTQESLKVNQCHAVFLERCRISGGWNVAVDFYGVHDGHLVNNVISGAGAWGLYVKGGSSGLRVEANELFDAEQGGFSAGDGTGFEYMRSPWLHYDAADIKFVNNVIHHVGGAGMAVWGGYNVLLAHNTLYRVGDRSHALEVVFGLRKCDGDTVRARENLDAGGWGTLVVRRDDPEWGEPIPNRHVYIFNNVLYNPAGFASPFGHFSVPGPRMPGEGTNIPRPATADEDLRIRGNVLWNGPADLPLMAGEPRGCLPGNPTCSDGQLRRDNTLNTLVPELLGPEEGDFRPVPGGSLARVGARALPDFPGGDLPSPRTPAGDLRNVVSRDREGKPRSGAPLPGAYEAP